MHIAYEYMQWGHHSLHRKQLLALLLFSALYGINLLVSGWKGNELKMGAMSAVALIIPTVSIIFFSFGWEAVWLYFLTPLPIIQRNTANCSTWFNADILFLCQDYNQNVLYFVPCKLIWNWTLRPRRGSAPSSHQVAQRWWFVQHSLPHIQAFPLGLFWPNTKPALWHLDLRSKSCSSNVFHLIWSQHSGFW